MDFAFTEAQGDLAELTRRIATDLATPERLRKLEQAERLFDPDLWAVLAEAGVVAAALPETAGGSGLGLLEQCSVLIELGRTLAPVPYLPTVVLACSALARFGTPEQVTRWVRPAVTGRLVLSVALTEPDGGDLAQPGTRAVPDGDGWTLTGDKTAVPMGAVADVVLVAATTPDGPGLFAVLSSDPGVQVRRQDLVDHDPAAWLELTEVRLPADRRIGVPGDGSLAWLARRATVAWCAYQLGVTERALELTAEHARTRVQFGRPIGTFQAVAQRLADTYIDVQGISLSLWNAAWLVGSAESAPGSAPGSEAGTEAEIAAAVATAKFWAADAGHRVAHTAVHVHGGTGLDRDHHLHRYFLAAKRAEFELGAATAQLRTLGAVLARA